MKKSLGAQRSPLFPMPVLMIGTYDENGNPDVMNMAWGGITFNGKITLNINRNHKTAKNIQATKAFTVSVATVETIREADFCGIVSANDTPDKVAKSGLHVRKAEAANAPVVDELPVAMVCRLDNIVEEQQTLHITGEIVDFLAEEDVLNANGQVNSGKLNGVVFDTFGKAYFAIGDKIADAWSVGKELQK